MPERLYFNDSHTHPPSPPLSLFGSSPFTRIRYSVTTKIMLASYVSRYAQTFKKIKDGMFCCIFDMIFFASAVMVVLVNGVLHITSSSRLLRLCQWSRWWVENMLSIDCCCLWCFLRWEAADLRSLRQYAWFMQNVFRTSDRPGTNSSCNCGSDFTNAIRLYPPTPLPCLPYLALLLCAPVCGAGR